MGLVNRNEDKLVALLRRLIAASDNWVPMGGSRDAAHHDEGKQQECDHWADEARDLLKALGLPEQAPDEEGV